MSLETTIAENTAAIRELIALLSIKSDTKVSHITEETKPAAAAKKPATTNEKTSADEAVSVTYQDAAKAIQDLAKTKGRDAAIAVLATFNAIKLPEVKESDFAAVVKACEAA